MSRVIARLVALAVALALLGLVGCARTDVQSGLSPGVSRAGESEVSMVNRIAYINNTGDLLLVDPDGSGETRVTGDYRAGVLSQALERSDSYAWPTWSRDGARIAVSRVSVSGPSSGLSVQVYDVDAGSMTTAYQNDLPAPVADGTPHYLFWAPDHQQLSFLAPTPEGLTLFVRDLRTDEEAGAVALGAPLYFDWAADSSLLAVHSGDRVSILEPTPEGDESSIAVDAVGFRAPAISPDGSLVAYSGIRGGVQGIFLAWMNPSSTSGAPISAAPRMLMETEGLTAFAWSPDGSTLAVAEQLRPGVPVFDRLRLVSADGQESATLVEEQLVGFFWSPQGDSVAWVGIDSLSRAMDLTVSRVESGKPSGDARHLFRFSPTGEVFTMLSFFDQYAYSHSIWAPDGSALVVAGDGGLQSGRVNGSGPHGGEIYVIDVSTGEARRIASGKLAVWSWN